MSEEVVVIGSAVCVILESELKENKSRNRRSMWKKQLMKIRGRYGGIHLLSNLRSDIETGQLKHFCALQLSILNGY